MTGDESVEITAVSPRRKKRKRQWLRSAKLRALALVRALERETAYDLSGKIATVRKALTINPTQMSKDLNNIEYLLSSLETAKAARCGQGKGP